MLTATSALAYVLLVWVHWGAFFADMQRRFPSIAKQDYRDDMAMALGFALVPVFWPIVPFLTGFYEHGWLNPLARAAKETR